MVKRDLVVRISKETGYPQREVMDTIQRFLDGVVEELSNGGNIEFRNFGVFELVTRKARVGRNPRKAAVAITIPERVVVKFRPGKILRDKVDKLTASDIQVMN
ncbi:MAG: HU family DNA-binding protein [Lentisphaeria bacterium]